MATCLAWFILPGVAQDLAFEANIFWIPDKTVHTYRNIEHTTIEREYEGAKNPGAQAVHADAPSSGEISPVGQSTQIKAFVWLENLPRGHC
jgi:hypothetical protein